MSEHIEHTGEVDCPACEQMHAAGKAIIELLNRSGLENGDRIVVLSRVLATGLQFSVYPHDMDAAIMALAGDIRANVDAIARVVGQSAEDARPAMPSDRPEQTSQTDVDRIVDKMLRASLSKPSKRTH